MVKLLPLIDYAYHNQQIDLTTYFMLKVFAQSCQQSRFIPENWQAVVSKIVDGSGAYGAGILAKTLGGCLLAQLAVVGLAAAFLYIMRQELPNQTPKDYAEFKAQFARQVGQLREKYGTEFDAELDIAAFEEWMARK